MNDRPASTLERTPRHAGSLMDGRPAAIGTGGRLRRRVQRLLVTAAEREEARLEQQLRKHPAVTRPNTVAVMSPKGGVGKTTATFLIGNLLASHLRLRSIAVDANRGFGTLAALAPPGRRSERSLADVIDDAETLNTAA